MSDTMKIRDLQPSDRHLARRARTWLIRTIGKRDGARLYLATTRPGGPRRHPDPDRDPVSVGTIAGFRSMRNMSRPAYREHVRRCLAMGVVLPWRPREAAQ